MITKDKIDLISVSLTAESIVKAAHTAYWFHCYANGDFTDHQEYCVVRDFLKLADLLGYRVEKIEDLAQAAE